MGRLAVRLACKRSRTAFTSRSRCWEYRNSQGARLDTNFRPQNYGAVGKTLLATTMMAEFFYFSMGSTFRPIGQSPTRNALVSEIRRDCKGLPPLRGSRAVLPRKISATAAAQPSEVTEIGQRWPRLVNVGRYCCATSGEEDRTVKLLPPPVRFASQLASHWTCR